MHPRVCGDLFGIMKEKTHGGEAGFYLPEILAPLTFFGISFACLQTTIIVEHKLAHFDLAEERPGLQARELPVSI